MTETIRNSTVLITGATGGIAKALIPALMARGAKKIYAAARDPSALAASDRLLPLKMDVTSDDDVNKAAAAATDVTLLINNAGLNHNTAFLLAADLSIAREEFECNYIAPLRVTRAFAPALIANKGAVLNILTILARVNLPFMGSYCASKAAALSLTQGLARRTGAQGRTRRRGVAGRGRYQNDRGLAYTENVAGGCCHGDPRRLRKRRGGDLRRRHGARPRRGSRQGSERRRAPIGVAELTRLQPRFVKSKTRRPS